VANIENCFIKSNVVITTPAVGSSGWLGVFGSHADHCENDRRQTERQNTDWDPSKRTKAVWQKRYAEATRCQCEKQRPEDRCQASSASLRFSCALSWWGDERDKNKDNYEQGEEANIQASARCSECSGKEGGLKVNETLRRNATKQHPRTHAKKAERAEQRDQSKPVIRLPMSWGVHTSPNENKISYA